MTDTLSPDERSIRMSKVRSAGNKSTEQAVESRLINNGITNWVKHPKNVVGKPDFYLAEYKIAIFVDGCFWHSCPKCNRHTPTQNSDFWKNKIETNRKRDIAQRRKLRRNGYHVLRVWEHEIKSEKWISRLKRMISKIQNTESLS